MKLLTVIESRLLLDTTEELALPLEARETLKTLSQEKKE